MFDAVGIVAVLGFAAALGSEYGVLSRSKAEVSLHLDPEALSAGFREGVSWHGLYREGTKIGYSRTERSRQADGYRTEHTMVLPVPGLSGTQTIAIITELDATFTLERFSASVRDGPLPVSASGRWDNGAVHVTVKGLPGGEQTTTLPMAEAPQMDQSFLPLATRKDLTPGMRLSFTHFDPLTASESTAVVEVVGPEAIDILGESTDALHVRQELSGQVLDVWINPLGEVLKQTLPGGLLAIRESEAEATWGSL